MPKALDFSREYTKKVHGSLELIHFKDEAGKFYDMTGNLVDDATARRVFGSEFVAKHRTKETCDNAKRTTQQAIDDAIAEFMPKPPQRKPTPYVEPELDHDAKVALAMRKAATGDQTPIEYTKAEVREFVRQQALEELSDSSLKTNDALNGIVRERHPYHKAPR